MKKSLNITVIITILLVVLISGTSEAKDYQTQGRKAKVETSINKSFHPIPPIRTKKNVDSLHPIPPIKTSVSMSFHPIPPIRTKLAAFLINQIEDLLFR